MTKVSAFHLLTLKLKPVSDLSAILSNFLSFFLLFTKSIEFFHDFPQPLQEFHDFPGLEIEIIHSTTFQVFHDLYEPWCITLHLVPLLQHAS